MQARWYLPTTGRFISADTIVPNPAESQSWNRYSYVFNRPTFFNDPSGHCPWCIPGALIGGAIGGAITGVTYLLTADNPNTGDLLLATGAGVVGGALIGTGVGATAGAAIISSTMATAATVAVGAGSGTLISAETYMATTDSFNRTDFAITTVAGGVEGGITAAIPGTGLGPVLTRSAVSSVVAGGEHIAQDAAHGTSSPGFLTDMTVGFFSALGGDVLSGGLARSSSIELPSAPEIRPTQWFERSALNYGHVIKAMQAEAHVINRNLFRETIYGVATNRVSPE